MRSMLVTGAAGFIGANFVHYWAERHPQDRLTVVDALTYAGNRASLGDLEARPKFAFVEGDICDAVLIGELLQAYAVDTIVHFAAESHVDRSIHGPDAFIAANIVGTHTLLKCAKAHWLNGGGRTQRHRFHHVSTDEVYGSLDWEDPAFTETTAYDPSSPYSASKAASDHLVRAYHRTYGLEVTISNCSNNYGPYHYPEKLIPLCIINALYGRDIPVYGEGRNVRDWLYVEDHCRGIELILARGASGHTYNIGARCERANIEVVKAICGIIDRAFAEDPALAQCYPRAAAAAGRASESLIRFVRDRPGHDLRYAMDTSKITGELGFEATETFETGIVKTVRWYLDNRDWWSPLLDDSYEQWLATQYAS